MARQLTEPCTSRGRGIFRTLKQLGVGFTTFAAKCGVSFSAWQRIVHAPDDPNAETVLVARLVRGGIPLHLVAPTLAGALKAAGWRMPEAVSVDHETVAQ